MSKKLVIATSLAIALAASVGIAPAQAATKTITVATEGTYAPFSYHDEKTGKLTGYDIEVIKAVAKKAGYKIKFKETTWDTIFAGLDAKRFDVIANQVTITAARQLKYKFSAPYTVSTEVVVARKDNTSFKSIASLAGLTAAQSATSNYRADAEKLGATIETVPGFTEALALVTAKRVDITLNDRLAVLDYLKNNKSSNLKVVASFTAADKQALVFLKTSKYAKPLSKALAALLKSGAIAKISKKYFGEDVTK